MKQKKVIVPGTETKIEKFRKFRDGGEERDKYWLVGAILAPLIIGLAVKFLAGGTYYLGDFPVTTNIVSGLAIFINFIVTYFFCFDRVKNPSRRV